MRKHSAMSSTDANAPQGPEGSPETTAAREAHEARLRLLDPPPPPPGLGRGYGAPGLLALRVGAVLLTAVSQPFLSAPFNWWPWHWVAWIPFLWAIFAQEGKGRIWLAMLGGTAANYMIFYWIVNLMPNFSNIPFYVAVGLNLLLCIWLSVIWIMLAWLLPKLRAYLPDHWVLAGPPLFLISSITGVYGVSFLVFWSNCVLFELWQRRKAGATWPRWMLTSLLATVALVLVFGFGRQWRYERAVKRAKKLKIGLIQSNFLPKDHGPLQRPSPFQVYKKLSKEAVKKGAQWVVWSEGEYKYPLSYAGAKKQLTQAIKEIGAPVLFGSLDIRKVGKINRYTNSAAHFHPTKGMGTIHDKVILVPFGEYMPFEGLLGFIYKRINWNSRYLAGEHMKVGQLDGIPYGFLICYEAIYPSLVQESVKRGARLLVNITYDAWFGKTTAPYQHLMLAATRSAETGVPLARLATTGASTVVDGLGRTAKLSDLFKRQILLYDIPLVYLPSIYNRVGDLFAFSCTVITLLLLLLAWVKRRLFLR